MNHNILSKNIFLIWFGDAIPSYVDFVIEQYKKLNKDFNIQFIHYTKSQILDKSTSDIVLQRCHLHLKKFIDKKPTKYASYIQYRIDNMFTYIQILSDIYRIEILYEYGGIYVDVDTLPIKSFNELLKFNCYCQSIFDIQSKDAGINFKDRISLKLSECEDINSIKLIEYDDNYFIALRKHWDENDLELDPYFRMPNKINDSQWLKNIETTSYFDDLRAKFFNVCLTKDDISYMRSKFWMFYVMHFSSKNWNTQSICENPLFCKFDMMLYPMLNRHNVSHIKKIGAYYHVSANNESYVNEMFTDCAQHEYAPDVIFEDGRFLISNPTKKDYERNGYVNVQSIETQDMMKSKIDNAVALLQDGVLK